VLKVSAHLKLNVPDGTKTDRVTFPSVVEGVKPIERSVVVLSA